MTERVFKVGDKVLWKITGKVYNVVANNTVRAVGRGSFSEGFLNSLADKSQYTITEGEEIMEHKFKKGDKVRVTSVDRNDEEDGIYIGCRGVIDEDDTAPYVVFPNARRAMMESQLELVENSADEEESGWIKWNGGECPVAADVIVQCMMRGGEDVGFWHMAELKGGEWDWSHTNHPGDIVSYRVVEEAKEEFTPGTTTVDVGSPVQEDSGSAATSKHYNSKLIQPIEIAQMVLTEEEFKGAMKFNIMKYTQRAGSKEGESSQKDWNKALQYKLWLELAEQGKTIDPREDVV